MSTSKRTHQLRKKNARKKTISSHQGNGAITIFTSSSWRNSLARVASPSSVKLSLGTIFSVSLLLPDVTADSSWLDCETHSNDPDQYCLTYLNGNGTVYQLQYPNSYREELGKINIAVCNLTTVVENIPTQLKLLSRWYEDITFSRSAFDNSQPAIEACMIEHLNEALTASALVYIILCILFVVVLPLMGCCCARSERPDIRGRQRTNFDTLLEDFGWGRQRSSRADSRVIPTTSMAVIERQEQLPFVETETISEPSVVKTPLTFSQRLNAIGLESTDSSIPRQFICPLSLEIMDDPVLACDTMSYEHNKIKTLFREENPISPITRKPFDTKKVFANHVVRTMISDFVEKKEKESSEEMTVSDELTLVPSQLAI